MGFFDDAVSSVKDSIQNVTSGIGDTFRPVQQVAQASPGLLAGGSFQLANSGVQGLSGFLSNPANYNAIAQSAGALASGGATTAGGLAQTTAQGLDGNPGLSNLLGLFQGAAKSGSEQASSNAGGYSPVVIPQNQQATLGSTLPAWLIPAAIGAGVLVLVLVLRK